MVLEQISLEIDFVVSYREADFCKGASNSHIFQNIADSKFSFLHGEEGCGKTHLAHIFCEKHGGILLDGDILHQDFGLLDLSRGCFAIDDVDRLSVGVHENLFHLYNFLNAEEHGRLLLTSSILPQAIIDEDRSRKHGIGDWHSRLLSFERIEIMTSAADDDLLFEFLRKNFQDRQIYAKSSELNYILRKSPRDFASLLGLVRAIHKRMLEKQARLSKTLIAELL